MYDQEYLEKLIADRIEENLHLDYKAAGALERKDPKPAEISKDVSSFANSDGGIIIYGIKEDQNNKHQAGRIDPVDRTIISKEWLEQIINSKIQPRLQGVVITPVEINNDINQVVYVVQIPKGSTAYQAEDKRYYRRYNFMSVPMNDYEIRDIINRTENTSLEIGDVKLTSSSGTILQQKNLHRLQCSLEINIINLSSSIENQYKLNVYLPNGIKRNNSYLQQNYLRSEGEYDIFSFPNLSPLFQGEVDTVAHLKFDLLEGMNVLAFPPLLTKLYFTNGVVEKEMEIWGSILYRGKNLVEWGW